MGKKTNRHSITLTDKQLELEKHVLTKHGYSSPSHAYISFLRHCGVTQAEHTITKDWEMLTSEQQDEIDDGILDLIEKKEGLRGSWLKHVIFEAIEEVNGKGAKSPRISEVEGNLSEATRAALVKRKRRPTTGA